VQLPDFINRMLGHADKAEANFTAAAALATANARIAALEAEAATLKSASTDGAVTITNLTAQLASVQADVSAKETEVKKLEAALAEAKGTANAVIASQGLAASELPPLDPRADGTPDPKTLTLTDRCLAAKAKTNGHVRN
jgi:hypothetical protein